MRDYVMNSLNPTLLLTKDLEDVAGSFKAIIDALPTGLIVADQRGILRNANVEAERLFGYEPGAMRDLSIETLVPMRVRANHVKLRTQFLAAPSKRVMGAGRDLHGVKADGSEFPLEIGLQPLRTDAGQMVIAVIADTSERKRAEDRMRSIFESAPNALILVDAHGIITLVNSQTENMFGYSRSELVGKPVEVLVPSRYQKNHPNLRTAFFSNPEARPMGAGRDLFGVCKDGREVPVEIGFRPTEIGGEVQVLAAIVDITERKGIEAVLHSTNVELQKKNQEMENFIFTVSHDLKSPMVTSTSYLQFLREDLDQANMPGVRDALDRIERSNVRMRQLINDLLNLSRVGRLEVVPLLFNFSAVATDLVADMQDRFAAAGVKVVVDPSADFELEADRARIQQVLENLLNNALQYGTSSADPLITVGLEVQDGVPCIFVRDNGKGINPEFHSKVFRLFERLETDREGTGIGLAIVSRIAEVHGGKAWVESAPGQGACFWLSLPKPVSSPRGFSR